MPKAEINYPLFRSINVFDPVGSVSRAKAKLDTEKRTNTHNVLPYDRGTVILFPSGVTPFYKDREPDIRPHKLSSLPAMPSK
jgi:hypothetical protein